MDEYRREIEKLKVETEKQRISQSHNIIDYLKVKARDWLPVIAITAVIVTLLLVGFFYKPIFAIVALGIVALMWVIMFVDRRLHPDKYPEPTTSIIFFFFPR